MLRHLKKGFEGDRHTLIACRDVSNHTVRDVAVSENANEALLVDIAGDVDDVSRR